MTAELQVDKAGETESFEEPELFIFFQHNYVSLLINYFYGRIKYWSEKKSGKEKSSGKKSCKEKGRKEKIEQVMGEKKEPQEADPVAAEKKQLEDKIKEKEVEIAKLGEAIAKLQELANNAIVAKTPEKQGKPLKDYLEDFYFFSGKASDITRQLALAGIAVIWIFKNTTTPIIPDSLIVPLKNLIVCLIIDILQYVYGAIGWLGFYEIKYLIWKRKIDKTQMNEEYKNLKAPLYISWPIIILFFLKIFFLMLAYKQFYDFFISLLRK